VGARGKNPRFEFALLWKGAAVFQRHWKIGGVHVRRSLDGLMQLWFYFMALAERVRGSFGPINKNKAAAGWPEWRRGLVVIREERRVLQD
jgi:hypothetical protein